MSTDQLWSTRDVLTLAARHRPGALIRTGRKALGWRQADLGARLGCSRSTVSRLEQGALSDLVLIRRAAGEVGVPRRAGGYRNHRRGPHLVDGTTDPPGAGPHRRFPSRPSPAEP
ncbi:helix-turn-helix domain-containing protein [Streptomyces sp. NPDC054854]